MAVNEGKQLKYFQLMEDLKEKILSGEIQAGDKLPSENELSGEYGISRQTVPDAAEYGLYLCGTWQRYVLFGTCAPYTYFEEYCGCDDVSVGLHFSACH